MTLLNSKIKFMQTKVGLCLLKDCDGESSNGIQWDFQYIIKDR